MKDLNNVMAQMVQLQGIMSTVTGFNLPPRFVSSIELVGELKATDEEAAATEGIEGLKAGRNILAAYFRNSVLDRKDRNNPEKTVTAKFTKEIASRRMQGFDADLIENMEVARREFEKAVNVETSGTFTQRVALYNEMRKAIVKADKMNATRLVSNDWNRMTAAVLKAGNGGARRREEMLRERNRDNRGDRA